MEDFTAASSNIPLKQVIVCKSGSWLGLEASLASLCTFNRPTVMLSQFINISVLDPGFLTDPDPTVCQITNPDIEQKQKANSTEIFFQGCEVMLVHH